VMGFGRHRGIVCFRSDAPLSSNVSNTDPGFRKVGPFGIPNDSFEPAPLPCEPLDDSPAAAHTARLVNRYVAESQAILTASPVNAARRARGDLAANILLFRDAGHQVPDLPSFRRRTGRTLSLHGQVPAEHGLMKLVGGSFTDSRQPEDVDDATYYQGLVDAALADPADVVVVHIKAPDEPGHDNRPDAKVRAIEAVDRLFVAPLARGLGRDDVLVLASDHSTPCEMGIHSADPVPVLVAHRRLDADGTQRYTEREAAGGGLGVGRAAELLAHLDRLLEGA